MPKKAEMLEKQSARLSVYESAGYAYNPAM
jgi:hypothetical protein